MTSVFQITSKVRDYELDMQGIVNNGVYFNYLEHARHEYLSAHGVDVVALAAQGINLVVIRSELDYKGSLKSGDKFAVQVSVERLSRIKIGFRQKVIRLSDQKLCVEALVVGTALNKRGRPYISPEIESLFNGYSL
ncbi:acyl-CoA thioesterase [Neptunomonas antarctica]|uniref:Acyl-CoA thioester hydrolase n=1 Tax=Neptunomonas antarctica TaxID=619304 RepID=A0A1N7MF06_9GAMM|nr:acyl-CoA thioesterase [Neptunomonas antarctica]SIS84725.1 acyl-CoA thioester hydrolase [Neptunomonas antarctica]